jgi:HSP20 family protein
MADKNKPEDPLGAVGDLLGGLGGLVDGLVKAVGELRDKAEADLQEPGADPTGLIRAVCGLQVRTVVNGESREVRVEPFGNVKPAERAGTRATVSEEIEPIVEVFDESDHVLVLAEMPGVGPTDVSATLDGKVLRLRGEKGRRKYRKDVELPQAFDASKLSQSCNNGVLEVRLAK